MGTPPASLKLDLKLGDSTAACGTRRYSAESVVDAFAGKITHPALGCGSIAIGTATLSTSAWTVEWHAARIGPTGSPAQAAPTSTTVHIPTRDRRLPTMHSSLNCERTFANMRSLLEFPRPFPRARERPAET